MNNDNDDDVRDPHSTAVEKGRVRIWVTVSYAHIHCCSVHITTNCKRLWLLCGRPNKPHYGSSPPSCFHHLVCIFIYNMGETNNLSKVTQHESAQAVNDEYGRISLFRHGFWCSEKLSHTGLTHGHVCVTYSNVKYKVRTRFYSRKLI